MSQFNSIIDSDRLFSILMPFDINATLSTHYQKLCHPGKTEDNSTVMHFMSLIVIGQAVGETNQSQCPLSHDSHVVPITTNFDKKKILIFEV